MLTSENEVVTLVTTDGPAVVVTDPPLRGLLGLAVTSDGQIEILIFLLVNFLAFILFCNNKICGKGLMKMKELPENDITKAFYCIQ